MVGCRREGCCKYKRIFKLHSQWAWRGSILIMWQHPGGIYSSFPSLETQALGYDLSSATWTQRVLQNKPAAAQRCLERGGGCPSRTSHTRQIKHWAAGWKHTKEARQQEYCQKKHDRQVEQHGERNNDARWRSITKFIHKTMSGLSCHKIQYCLTLNITNSACVISNGEVN